ncbi:hypothetical protein M3570_21640 [Bacillus subtilis]|nr:hypothetical protein [Bacillus subtilis]MCM3016268.1 hypothetical protein [Bacillus subtilis]
MLYDTPAEMAGSNIRLAAYEGQCHARCRNAPFYKRAKLRPETVESV